MSHRHLARHMRSHRMWSSSSEESVNSEDNTRPLGWYSLPGTPSIPRDTPLLKEIKTKYPSNTQEWVQQVSTNKADSSLIATFPTFHLISVASGSPVGARRCSSDAEARGRSRTRRHSWVSDAQVTDTERESSTTRGESTDTGCGDGGKERVTKKDKSFFGKKQSASEKQKNVVKRDISAPVGTASVGEFAGSVVGKPASVTGRESSIPRREIVHARESNIPCRESSVPARKVAHGRKSYIPLRESSVPGKERSAHGRERSVPRRKNIIIRGGRNVPEKVTESGKKILGSERKGRNIIEPRQQSVNGRERKVLDLECSVRGKERSVVRERRTGHQDKGVSGRDKCYPGKAKRVSGKERRVHRRERLALEGSVTGRGGSLTKRKKSIPGIDGRFSGTDWSIVTGITARALGAAGKERNYGKGEKVDVGRGENVPGREIGVPRQEGDVFGGGAGAPAGERGDQVSEAPGTVGGAEGGVTEALGHTSTTTRILLELIQDLEADMNYESDLGDSGVKAQYRTKNAEALCWPSDPMLWPEDPNMSPQGEAFLSTNGVCLNVTRRHKSRTRTVDHFNLDSSVWRDEKDLAGPTDFLTDLTEILNKKLRKREFEVEPPLDLVQDHPFWKYVESHSLVNPLDDHRFQTSKKTVKQFRSHPGVYTFAVGLSDIESVESETDCHELKSLVEVGGGGAEGRRGEAGGGGGAAATGSQTSSCEEAGQQEWVDKAPEILPHSLALECYMVGVPDTLAALSLSCLC
ncbi:putative Titin-like 28 [Homarus americanus]|uniref:Putative Titin-like 28 n=1 Tax=Homarus americanus TaxID=6706 RepID=A0A8J5MYB3_HOMAM|nr:putative Titin-like 28 [Homarus americanus]